MLEVYTRRCGREGAPGQPALQGFPRAVGELVADRKIEVLNMVSDRQVQSE
jgi:hypothetical protein